MEPCPAESTKRSRFAQRGSFGLKRRCRLQSTNAIGAAPMGIPGWPLFAFSTASTARKRMVSMHFFCSSGVIRGSRRRTASGSRWELRLARRESGRAEDARTRVEDDLHGHPLQHRAHAALVEEGRAETAVFHEVGDLRGDAASDVDSTGREGLQGKVSRFLAVELAEQLDHL